MNKNTPVIFACMTIAFLSSCESECFNRGDHGDQTLAYRGRTAADCPALEVGSLSVGDYFPVSTRSRIEEYSSIELSDRVYRMNNEINYSHESVSIDDIRIVLGPEIDSSFSGPSNSRTWKSIDGTSLIVFFDEAKRAVRSHIIMPFVQDRKSDSFLDRNWLLK